MMKTFNLTGANLPADMANGLNGDPDVLDSRSRVFLTNSQLMTDSATVLKQMRMQDAQLESEAFQALAERSQTVETGIRQAGVYYKLVGEAILDFSKVLRSEQEKATGRIDELREQLRAQAAATDRHAEAKAMIQTADPAQMASGRELAEQASSAHSAASQAAQTAATALADSIERVQAANSRAAGKVQTAPEAAGVRDTFFDQVAHAARALRKIATDIAKTIAGIATAIGAIIAVAAITSTFMGPTFTVQGIMDAIGAIRTLLRKGPPPWLVALLTTGEIPPVSQVGALVLLQALLMRGLADDGVPYLGGRPRPIESSGIKSISDIANLNHDIYMSKRKGDADDRGEIQVTGVTGPDGVRRYIVNIPGTLEELGDLNGWDGSTSGADWPANLQLIAYGTSSFYESVKAAIARAVAADGGGNGRPEILLSGHSQGGIVAAALAADPSFQQAYNVRGVMAMSSPIETFPIPTTTPVYNVLMPGDIVPKLDLGGVSLGTLLGQRPVLEHQVTVQLPDTVGNFAEAHHHRNVAAGVSWLDGGNGSGENLQKMQAMRNDFKDFLGGTEVAAFRVEVGRE